MYSEKFIKVCQGYKIKLDNLQRKDYKQYILELNNFSEILEMILPADLEVFLNSSGISSSFKLWKDSSLAMIKCVDEYGIDLENKKIFIKKGIDVIEYPLLDVNEYIKSLNFAKDSWEYFLSLSLMIRPSTYEYYQITNAIILGS
jgi:hypothetical protein